MTNEEYIRLHLHDDVRALALRRPEEGVDARWCLQQIEGWQRAVDKLPRWAQTLGLWFPPSLSMEQCSGEWAAKYKGDVARRLLSVVPATAFADLTGGYGIDFSYMAPLFVRADYVEHNSELCRIAEHNFSALGLQGVRVKNADSIEFLSSSDGHYDLIYLDPARRDVAGRKTVAIEDCSPDVCALQDRLLALGRHVMVKLSPMLDISAALARLRHVCEVHVVCVRGECKELLFVLSGDSVGTPVYHAVNLSGGAGDGDLVYVSTREEMQAARPLLPDGSGKKALAGYLYEPHAGILKAGLQDTLCRRYGLTKLHPMSNLFTSDLLVEHFPGRAFEVLGHCGFGKRELRSMLGDITCANLTIRNFPTTVATLRKRLRLREGGDVYLFATTLHDGSHALIRCRKQA